MKTLLRIGAAVAAIMTLAAFCAFVLVQRQNVVAANPPQPSEVYVFSGVRAALPALMPSDETRVSLKVKIVEIDREKLAELGIGLAAFTQDEDRPTAVGEAKENAVQIASLDRRTADLFISSLRANGVAKILAEPSLVSTDGHPARFHSGGEFPILSPQSEGSTSVEFREFGTSIDFTATKQSSGKLRLDMRVVQSEIDPSRSVTVDGHLIPGLKSRSIDTALELQSGKTAMIYGELGDGLLIMVTPELVEPVTAAKQTAAVLPNSGPVEQRQPTPSDLPAVAKPAPAARPLRVAREPAKIAMNALIYKVDSVSLAENGIDLAKEFSTAPTDPYDALTRSSFIDARRFLQLSRRLSKANGADVLSRPQVLTISGKSAQIEVGSEVRIPTPGSIPPVKSESHKVGVSVTLVPVALADGQIRIDARVDHSYVEDDNSLKSTTLFGKADLFTGETLVVYEEGSDVLLFVTPRLIDSDVSAGPSRTKSPPVAETPLPLPQRIKPTTIPKGMRVVSVRSANRIDVEPGELVDVIGIPTSTAAAPEILLTAAQVFSVEQDVAALMMAPADAVKISLASEHGAIRLVRATEISSAQAEAEVELRQLKQHLGSQHPSVKKLESRIDNLAKYSLAIHAQRTDQEREMRARSFNEFKTVAKELFPDAAIDLRAIGNGVVLSGTVNDHEQDRVLSAIAEDLFPNVINNLRRIAPGDTTSGDTVGTLQETLAELFPDAQIKVRPLRSSVVLSGTIDRELADQAVRIAEDFYPQVLDHTRRREVQGAPVATNPYVANEAASVEEPAVKSTSINEELRGLREDVRVLRRDVRRLIKILEERDSSSPKAAPSTEDQSSNVSADADEVVWQMIGIRVEPTEFESDRFRGGLKIVEVRPDSPALQGGIQHGDILVGLDKWETISLVNLHYVVGRIDENKAEPLKFIVLRGEESRIGHMKLAGLSATPVYKEVWEVTLDEVISIGLQNSKVIRNLGGATPVRAVGKKEVILSRGNKEIGLADFETAIRTYVSDTARSYWELWSAQRNLETARKSRDAARDLWNVVVERKAAGAVQSQAEVQAREQYFYFRDQVQSALTELYSCEERLRFLVGLAGSDGRRIRASDEPTTDEYKIDWDEANKSALSNSVALRHQRQVLRQAERELVARKNNLLPQLDPAATYRWSGGSAFEVELSQAYDWTTRALGVSGIEFQFPVGVRREAAALRNAELKVAREEAVLQELELSISHRLSAVVREVDDSYRSAQAYFNRWKAVATEVESTTAMYRDGKTTLDLVLDAQRRAAQSEREYTSMLALYATAIEELHFCQGTLLAQHHLVIEASEESEPAAEKAFAPRPAAIPDPTSQLEPGDRLTVDSFADPTLNRHVSILPDGTITLPLLGQVAAAGQTLTQLSEQLRKLYSKSYSNPAISLSFYGTSVRIDDSNRSDIALAQLENTPDPTANLKPGDQLIMESLVDPTLNRRLMILGDGSITLPLLGQVEGAGRTLKQLADQLHEAYKKHYKEPALTLSFAGTSLPARN